jgi:rhombotail lipoprotein
MKTLLKNTVIIIGVFGLAACSAIISQHGTKKTVSSSLVDFLYPDVQSREDHKAEIPTLTLPVKVGVSFVPPTGYVHNDISRANQHVLLEKVKRAFTDYDYIEHIEIIPSTYLKGGEGFVTLDQVARLYDVDVMALVSYDQVTQSVENNAALLYWTIVGMYLIPGNENSIQTFVDTAVFDVKSRKMLFRAPGLSKLETRTTAIGIDEEMSEKSLEGFEQAMANMNDNLTSELTRFKTRVKEEKVANIKRKDNYHGSTMGLFLLALFPLVLLRRRQLHIKNK